MATSKQLAFITRLVQEKHYDLLGLVPASLSVGEASKLIGKLLSLKTGAAAKPTGFTLSMPGGSYAVPGADGALRFIHVSAPTEGKWSGWYFVSVQAGEEHHKLGSQRPGQSYAGKLAGLLAAIQRDPKAASATYGRELGRCGVCGRALTDELSRERGIGPVCYEKLDS